MPFQVDLVSPERIVFSGEADMVVARTDDGDIAFQPGHVPFVGVLQPWEVKVNFVDGTSQRIAVHSGFVEVSGDHVTVLSDVAELGGDIDIERAREAMARAEAALAVDVDDQEATAARQRAEVRLSVAGAAETT
jgi:F-type H+-transporting ATPase subunit epsilon